MNIWAKKHEITLTFFPSTGIDVQIVYRVINKLSYGCAKMINGTFVVVYTVEKGSTWLCTQLTLPITAGRPHKYMYHI